MNIAADVDRPSIDKIIATVGRFYRITSHHLRGPSRVKEFARARQVAMWVAHVAHGYSTPDVGRAFGGRDHSTVVYSVQRVEYGRETCLKFAAELQEIVNRLEDIRKSEDLTVIDLATAGNPALRSDNLDLAKPLHVAVIGDTWIVPQDLILAVRGYVRARLRLGSAQPGRPRIDATAKEVIAFNQLLSTVESLDVRSKGSSDEQTQPVA